jgi:hypothetical protein
MPAQRPLYDKPFGAESYDGGALSEKQQEKLNQRKVSITIIKVSTETKTKANPIKLFVHADTTQN